MIRVIHAFLLWLPPLLAAVSVYILARVGLEGALEVGAALRQRLRGRVRARWKEQAQTTVVNVKRSTIALPLASWPCLAAGVFLAVLWLHPVLSLWFLVLGVAAGRMLVSTRPVLRRENLHEMEAFVSALRSVFGVGQSVFVSLQTVAEDLEAGPLREAILEAVRRYNADMDAGRALRALSESGWPFLERLALVLEQVQFADDEAVRQALLNLESQVHAARRLQDRAQITLTLTRLTLRALQAANLAALAAVTVLPLWRAFYAARPLALIAATGMALAGSWYFAGEIRRMEKLL